MKTTLLIATPKFLRITTAYYLQSFNTIYNDNISNYNDDISNNNDDISNHDNAISNYNNAIYNYNDAHLQEHVGAEA